MAQVKAHHDLSQRRAEFHLLQLSQELGSESKWLLIWLLNSLTQQGTGQA